jgi:hypothetical protein
MAKKESEMVQQLKELRAIRKAAGSLTHPLTNIGTQPLVLDDGRSFAPGQKLPADTPKAQLDSWRASGAIAPEAPKEPVKRTRARKVKVETPSE